MACRKGFFGLVVVLAASARQGSHFDLPKNDK
jgi:hypothetical protein